MRGTHNLQACAEALGEVPAFFQRPPGVSRYQRGEHRGQVDAMLTGAGIPAQSFPFAQPAAALGTVPAGVEVHALVASHLGINCYPVVILRDRAGR